MKTLLLILALFVGSSFSYTTKFGKTYEVWFGEGVPSTYIGPKIQYPLSVKRKNIQGCVFVKYDLIQTKENPFSFVTERMRYFYPSMAERRLYRNNKKENKFRWKIIESFPPGVFDGHVEKILKRAKYSLFYYDLAYENDYKSSLVNSFRLGSNQTTLGIYRSYKDVYDLYTFQVRGKEETEPMPAECTKIHEDLKIKRKDHYSYVKERESIDEQKRLIAKKAEDKRLSIELEKKRKEYLIELIQRCENFGFKDPDDFPPCIQRETFNDKRLFLLEEQNAQMKLALEQANQRRSKEIARLNQQIKDNQIMNAIIAGLNNTSWQGSRQANEISTLRNEVRLLKRRPVPPPPR